MKSVKAALLLTTAMAVAALAGPVAAQAKVTDWLSEGAPLESTHNATLTGKITVYAGGAGGFKCDSKANLELGPGSAGNITSLTLGPCSVFGGWGLVCPMLTKVEATGLPAAAYPEENAGVASVKVDDLGLAWEWVGGGMCSTTKFQGVFDIQGAPDNREEISETVLSGGDGNGWSILAPLQWDPAGVYGI